MARPRRVAATPRGVASGCGAMKNGADDRTSAGRSSPRSPLPRTTSAASSCMHMSRASEEPSSRATGAAAAAAGANRRFSAVLLLPALVSSHLAGSLRWFSRVCAGSSSPRRRGGERPPGRGAAGLVVAGHPRPTSYASPFRPFSPAPSSCSCCSARADCVGQALRGPALGVHAPLWCPLRYRWGSAEDSGALRGWSIHSLPEGSSNHSQASGKSTV